MEGKKDYPVVASAYTLLEEIGYGRSATVFRALCIPFDEIVSIKSIDLEKCKNDLDEVRREALTMSLINHPNVITAHSFFVVGQSLWLVMPYMAGGSCLTIMRTAYPAGLEESVIATVLRECLKALEYLHFHGHIHRDIKAGNILVDEHGMVRLGDFGVSACVFDCHSGNVMRRTTFTGTPCWMAPEVLDSVCGYDSKADIWSLGITALELAQGHAPFSNLPPLKILQMQLQRDPPSLEESRSKDFSKLFKDFVSCCLVNHLLNGLPPLWKQVNELRSKDAAELAKRGPIPTEQTSSPLERRFSGWIFDVGDLGGSSRRQDNIPEEDEKKHVDEETSSNTQQKPSTSGSR